MQDSAGVIRPEAKRFRGRLGWAVELGTLLGLGIGCGIQDPRLGRGPDLSGGFQWAAADTSRLLRNAHYFKQIGQPELGAKELEEAYRLDPGNLEVADALAQYYDELGMGARAQQVYRKSPGPYRRGATWGRRRHRDLLFGKPQPRQGPGAQCLSPCLPVNPTPKSPRPRLFRKNLGQNLGRPSLPGS